MTLALLVAFGALGCWVAILTLRWLRVTPTSPESAVRALFAAAGLSGAYIVGGYPLIWATLRNLHSWAESRTTAFTFAGNLPSGIDEDDLLLVIEQTPPSNK